VIGLRNLQKTTFDQRSVAISFEPVNIQQALGKILAHNLSDHSGKRRIRKGTLLNEKHIALLGELGLSQVYVDELEDHDLPEEQVALRIAACLAVDHIDLQGASTGRTHLIATCLEFVTVDLAGLEAVNWIQGVTVATLP
jgi:hypothetical protein